MKNKILSFMFAVICVACGGGNGKAVVSGESSHDTIQSLQNEEEECSFDDKSVIPAYDFTQSVQGDTVYFKVLKEKASVSLVYWERSNFGNHVLKVPSQVFNNGKAYRVVEIGNEAMGVEFYGDKEGRSIWGGNGHKVEKVVLPTNIRRTGYAAFSARLRSRDFEVQLTDSVEEIADINCMAICGKHDAIILPTNLRSVWLSDDEDHEIDGEYVDFKFSKLYIPERLQYIGGLEYFERNQPMFKKIEIHPKNRHFRVINGALYSYKKDVIYWSTIGEDLYIPKQLCVNEDVIEKLEDGWYPHIQMPKLKSIVTEPGNPYCVAIDNVLYDKKNGSMILATDDKKRVAHVPAWCKSIKFMEGYESTSPSFSLPYKYHFADDAPQENVDSFIEALKMCTYSERTFVFTYKGKSWTIRTEDR